MQKTVTNGDVTLAFELMLDRGVLTYQVVRLGAGGARVIAVEPSPPGLALADTFGAAAGEDESAAANGAFPALESRRRTRARAPG